MVPLSNLTLTSYRLTQPNRDPVEERRSKTLAALEQQKLVDEIIASEIARFSKALPNKEMHFQGNVELDFTGRNWVILWLSCYVTGQTRKSKLNRFCHYV